MKAKNVILGLCAIVFAIGSAFATLDVNTLANEKIRVDTHEDQGENCVTETVCLAARTCVTSGTFPCTTTVNSAGLPLGSAIANVRDGSQAAPNCGQTLMDTSDVPVAAITNDCIVAVY